MREGILTVCVASAVPSVSAVAAIAATAMRVVLLRMSSPPLGPVADMLRRSLEQLRAERFAEPFLIFVGLPSTHVREQQIRARVVQGPEDVGGTLPAELLLEGALLRERVDHLPLVRVELRLDAVPE